MYFLQLDWISFLKFRISKCTVKIWILISRVENLPEHKSRIFSPLQAILWKNDLELRRQHLKKLEINNLSGSFFLCFSDCLTENINITSYSDLFFLQSNISGHQNQFHTFINIWCNNIFANTTQYAYTSSICRQTR